MSCQIACSIYCMYLHILHMYYVSTHFILGDSTKFSEIKGSDHWKRLFLVSKKNKGLKGFISQKRLLKVIQAAQPCNLKVSLPCPLHVHTLPHQLWDQKELCQIACSIHCMYLHILAKMYIRLIATFSTPSSIRLNRYLFLQTNRTEQITKCIDSTFGRTYWYNVQMDKWSIFQVLKYY